MAPSQVQRSAGREQCGNNLVKRHLVFKRAALVSHTSQLSPLTFLFVLSSGTAVFCVCARSLIKAWQPYVLMSSLIRQSFSSLGREASLVQ